MSRYNKFLLFLLGVFAIIVLVLLVVNKRSKPNPQPSERNAEYYEKTVPSVNAESAVRSPTGSYTYRNNLGTNIMGGQVGSFRKSSFSWTITKNNDKLNIKTNAMSGSFNVLYSHYDSPNQLYHYDVSGSGVFDNAVVKLVMTNGKLDQYATGDLSSGNLLTILFIDNNGYLYKLGK